MSQLRVHDMQGACVGEVEFPDGLLVRGRGAQAVHDVVVAHLARRRAGTASTLRKGEVAGSGRKPWRQKGTGRARAGYRRSPVWRGGAVVFGPQPRDYSWAVPRKVAQLAFRRAWSDRVLDGAVRVVERLELAAPKTKLCASFLRSLGLAGRVLIILEQPNATVVKAARNLPGVAVTTAREVDTYTLVRHATIVVTRAALDEIKRRLERGTGATT